MKLFWTASTPPGTSIKFAARTANTMEELATTSFVTLATQPAATSPVDMGAALETARPGSSKATFLQLEIRLSSSQHDLTPVLTSLGVTSMCEALE